MSFFRARVQLRANEAFQAGTHCAPESGAQRFWRDLEVHWEGASTQSLEGLTAKHGTPVFQEVGSDVPEYLGPAGLLCLEDSGAQLPRAGVDKARRSVATTKTMAFAQLAPAFPAC